MANPKSFTSKEAKSALSANANIFIPRATPLAVPPGVNNVIPYPGGVNPVQEIPAYMINCYPFVNEGDVNKKSTRWPPANSVGPTTGFKSQVPSVKIIGAVTDYDPIQQQQPLNVCYPPPAMRVGGVNPLPIATVQPPSPSHHFLEGDINFNHPQNWASKLGHGRGRGSTPRPKGHHQGRSLYQGDWVKGGYSSQKSSDQGSTQRNVSANRRAGNHGNSTRIECQRHTLIYVDSAVQTDFADSIANLTLKDKPNALYRNLHPKRGEFSKGGNQSDEVDSDSGYSSPLHRKNMVSNGTHPLDPQHCDNAIFSPNQPTNESCDRNLFDMDSPRERIAEGVSLATSLSYAAMVQKTPTQRIIDNTTNQNSKGRNQNSDISKDPHLESSEGKAKKKRKRVRRRKKKAETPEEMAEAEDHGLHFKEEENHGLHFQEAEDDFPELIPTNPIRQENTVHTSSEPFQPSSCLVHSGKTTGSNLPDSPSKSSRSVSFYPTPHLHDDSDPDKDGHSESKMARKRRKRREKANKAAEDELAEISFEQHMLRELNMKKQPVANPGRLTLAQRLVSSQPITVTKTLPQQEAPSKPIKEAVTKTSGKKSQQPIAFDIGAMIDALEHKKKDNGITKKQPTAISKSSPNNFKKGAAPNMLDSSAPVVKRGKERENTKPKKPSPLKKVILKEREERKRSRSIGEDTMVGESMSDLPRAAVGVGVVTAESDVSQDGVDNSENESSRVQGVPIPKAQNTDIGGTPANSDLSPISQSSPISMTPLSSGVNSPIVGHVTKEVTQAALKIHSRRFREYCHQVLDKDIDACCTTLLQDLVRFQDRSYHKDPTKAKSKRRFVLGLREVTKHLKLKKIKCVIISPNLEKIQSKGGLDEALNKIIELCNEQNIPFVFALGRRALGRACAKLVPVSVAGIFNYEGSEANFQQLMDLSAVGRQAYKDMVSAIEREIIEHPVKVSSHIYAHMGHSRTPSACSAISFTSSVLSEPISENYPQSEPEVDSKGNEIITDYNQTTTTTTDGKAPTYPSDRKSESTSSQRNVHRHFDEIDDGNEADTEDIDTAEMLEQPAIAKQSEDDGKTSPGNVTGQVADLEEGFADDVNDEVTGNQDNIKDLPHIDSFHASTHDLSAEILSQHSARTGDTVEGASTHSSKTIEGSCTPLPEPHRSEQHGVCIQDSTKGVAAQNTKTVDSERIKTWVEQSQTCFKFQMDEVESTSESQQDVGNSSTDDLLDVDSKLSSLTLDTYL